MRYIFTSFVLILLYSYPSSAQQWEKVYTDEINQNGRCVISDKMGNIYIGGGIRINEIWTALLFKIDAAGNLLWKQHFQNLPYIKEIQITNEGECIIAGTTQRLPHQLPRMVISKIDKSGKIVWTNFFQDQYSEQLYAMTKLNTTPHFALLGSRLYSDVRRRLFHIITFNADGKIFKEKEVSFEIDSFIPQSIIFTNEESFVVAGAKGRRGLVFGLDDDGGMNWSADSCGGLPFTSITSITQNKNGDIYALCQYDEKNLGYLINNKEGICKAVERKSGGSLILKKVIATPDGGYAMIGRQGQGESFKGDIFLLKINARGDVEFSSSYGGYANEKGFDVCMTADDGFLLVGDCEFTNDMLMTGVYIIKTDTNGKTGGAQQIFNVQGEEIESYPVSYVANELFEEPLIIQPSLSYPTIAQNADLNNDGVLDVVLVSDKGHTLAWYEGSAMQKQQTITAGFEKITAIELLDMDGDGDVDILTATNGLPSLIWWENKNGVFIESHTVHDQPMLVAKILPVDFDDDGDTDILCMDSGYGGIQLFEQLNDHKLKALAGIQHKLSETHKIELLDVDSNGNLDLIIHHGKKYSEGHIGWYELDVKDKAIKLRQNIKNAKGMSFCAALFDRKNIAEIIIAENSYPFLRRYQFSKSQKEFTLTDSLSIEKFRSIADLHAIDIDNDDDKDLFVDVVNQLWMKNVGGTFEKPRKVGSRLSLNDYTVIFDDLDRDGDIDMTFTFERVHKLNQYFFQLDKDTFYREQYVVPVFTFYNEPLLVDVDGDGYLDINYTSKKKGDSGWFINQKGIQFKDEKHTRFEEILPPSLLTIADVDGNGKEDFIMISDTNIILSVNGAKNNKTLFSNRKYKFAKSLHSIDIDGDGDLDIFVFGTSNTAFWCENLDGNGVFSNPVNVHVSGNNNTLFANVDEDPAIELISGSANATGLNIVNIIPKQSFIPLSRKLPKEFRGSKPWALVDFDKDGILEIIGTCKQDKSIFKMQFDGSYQYLLENNKDYLKAIIVNDIDRDGDLDIISGGKDVRWLENVSGTLKTSQLLYAPYFNDTVRSMQIVDFNQDGKSDLFISWISNKLICFLGK